MIFYIICNVLAILLLLKCGAFFAGTETAYTSLSTVSVKQMLSNNEKNSELVAKLRSNLDMLISTVLIGTNFVNTLNSALVTAFALKVFGTRYITAATFAIFVLIIIFAEIIPKSHATFCKEKVAQDNAKKINFIQKTFYPVVYLFFKLSKLIESLERSIFRNARPLITEEELKLLLEVGANEGTLEHNEHLMLERIFEFTDLTIHDIMRHRSLVKYVDVNDSFEKVLSLFEETHYSRLPVYEGNPENIIGVIHYKSVLYADDLIVKSKDFVRICTQKVLFLPETMAADELLKVFKKEHMHFAVALNEYGEMAGIVTLDNLMREVFGRITDEHGMVESTPDKRISVVNVNEFLVPGDIDLDDLNEYLDLDLKSELYNTLGGFLLEKMGELPVIGSIYKHEGVYFIIEDQSQRRIQTVRIRL
ncbi:MAG: hemolysin family protein [Treponema sp.]|nr:hemolysin family protein [Treponema sp.]